MMMTVMKDGLDDTGRGCCRASAVAYATWLEPVVTMDDNELENYRGSNKNFTKMTARECYLWHCSCTRNIKIENRGSQHR